jgi:hypothetical protein
MVFDRSLCEWNVGESKIDRVAVRVSRDVRRVKEAEVLI